MRAQTGNGQQKHRQQLGPEDTVENTGRVVEVYQNPVYHLKVQMPCGDTWIAVHINVYHQKKILTALPNSIILARALKSSSCCIKIVDKWVDTCFV